MKEEKIIECLKCGKKQSNIWSHCVECGNPYNLPEEDRPEKWYKEKS